jgi:protein-tyrosine phosphatase
VTVSNPSNFRDLASFVSRPLRPRTLYRSDHLGALDEDDARQIRALGIQRVLDFRGVRERVLAQCQVPDVAVHSLSIEPTIVQVISDLVSAGHQLTEQEVVVHMQDTYRGFVRHNTHRFAEFFGHLLQSSEPTVFHCTAGKDRTGFAAALVLRALDVPQDEVLRDYMHTNERLKIDASGWKLPPHAAQVLVRVQPEFLDAAFQAIGEDYGGIDNYLRYGLGLRDAERARLRQLYLQAG